MLTAKASPPAAGRPEVVAEGGAEEAAEEDLEEREAAGWEVAVWQIDPVRDGPVIS